VLFAIYKAIAKGLFEPHVLASLKTRVINFSGDFSVLFAS